MPRESQSQNDNVISFKGENTNVEPGTSAIHSTSYNNGGGGGNMNDKYVTKEYLNAKLETIDAKIDALSKHIDDKFDQIPNVIENSILKEREFQREQQKETKRFFWGTIFIGGISAVAGVAAVIVSLILR